MKILHVTKKYPNALGGDAIVVSCLEREQRLSGHNVFILTSNCPNITENENVFKYGLRDLAENQDRITPKRVISLFLFFFWGFFYVQKIKPNVIHSHSPDLGFFISCAALIYRIPVINTCHGISFPYPQFSLLKRISERFFLKYGRFQSIITVDKISLEYFRDAGIGPVKYIPNGVEFDSFSPAKAKKENVPLTFLFVGRLELQKGVEYLISAVRLLKEQGLKFRVIIVGAGSMLSDLKRMAENQGISGIIEFKGCIDFKKIPEVYRLCDAYVLPSVWEGFPVTILEAWAARLPVITTDVGGVSGECIDGKNAIVVPEKDPCALASAMRRVLEDKDLRKALSDNGEQTVRKEHSWKKIAKETENIYLGK